MTTTHKQKDDRIHELELLIIDVLEGMPIETLTDKGFSEGRAKKAMEILETCYGDKYNK